MGMGQNSGTNVFTAKFSQQFTECRGIGLDTHCSSSNMLFSISPEMSPFCPFFLQRDPENHSSKNRDYFRYLPVSSYDFWVYHTMIATYFPMVDIFKLVDSGCYPPSEKLSGSWFQIFFFNHRNEEVKPATSCGFLQCPSRHRLRDLHPVVHQHRHRDRLDTGIRVA